MPVRAHHGRPEHRRMEGLTTQQRPPVEHQPVGSLLVLLLDGLPASYGV